jgi:hypothetical protein
MEVSHASHLLGVMKVTVNFSGTKAKQQIPRASSPAAPDGSE